ncbi:MAG TPA: hypothetical protein VEG61_05880 [Candidatus Dormibacteraeota bacterium]|nr:hypothetical protein [Candidatus Dormibacteraeota bacterium]
MAKGTLNSTRQIHAEAHEGIDSNQPFYVRNEWMRRIASWVAGWILVDKEQGIH